MDIIDTIEDPDLAKEMVQLLAEKLKTVKAQLREISQVGHFIVSFHHATLNA